MILINNERKRELFNVSVCEMAEQKAARSNFMNELKNMIVKKRRKFSSCELQQSEMMKSRVLVELIYIHQGESLLFALNVH